MARIGRKTKRDPSDLTDEKCVRIAPLMPEPGRRGRPREVEFREVINAVRYLARSGCGWRMPPVHFGPWQTVYRWFRELARRFLFQTIHDVALMVERERVGRKAGPSAAVIDSQSVKAPHAETRGYDAAKKIVGRKRPIAVDADGAYDCKGMMDKAAFLDFVVEVVRRCDGQSDFQALPRRWVWRAASAG